MGDSKDLFDMMLDDSSKILKKELGTPEHLLRDEPEPESEPEPKEWPQDVEMLLELTSKDFRSWLAAIKPGDLLTVVSRASETLRQRVMEQLDDESVQWLKSNLELFDTPTDALLSASRESVLSTARELLAEGKIAQPETAAQLEQKLDTANVAALDELTTMLLQLVAVAHKKGVGELAAIADEAPHPLLKFGLSCLSEDSSPETLTERLNERQKALEASYRAELELVRQALIAMAKGTDPKTFYERVKTARGR